MWFKKKKKVTFNIEINEINSYISENYVPDENEKQIKFQAKKKAEPEPEIRYSLRDDVSFSISDSKPVEPVEEKVRFSISDREPVEEKVSFSISDSEPVEESVSFSISDKPSSQYMLDLGDLDDIENISEKQAAEKLDEVIKESFSDVLVNYIIEKDVKNSYVYKKAQVDRKLFSKIISKKWYSPSKDTAISLAIALKLNLDETNHLIAKAGYTLSNSKKKDLIIAYFISKEIYDIDTINDTLYRLDERPLGRF